MTSLHQLSLFSNYDKRNAAVAFILPQKYQQTYLILFVLLTH